MDLTTLIEKIVNTPEYMTAAVGSIGALLGALVAVFSGFVSAWLTNRQGRKLLEQQLAADSLERKRERLLTLRREIYLPVADATSAAQAALARMLLSDRLDDDFTSHMRTLGQTIARVELVATAETLKHTTALQRALFEASMAGQKRRWPMVMRRSEIDVVNEEREKAHQSWMQGQERVDEYLRSGARDEHRWEILTQQRDSARKRWRELSARWARLGFEHETDRLALAREFSGIVENWGELQARFTASLRGELEVAEEWALLAQQSRDSTEIALATFRELIPMFERSLEELRPKLEADYEWQPEGN